MEVKSELVALAIIGSWTIFVSLMFAPMLVFATLRFIRLLVKNEK